jgi:hypothetical protein
MRINHTNVIFTHYYFNETYKGKYMKLAKLVLPFGLLCLASANVSAQSVTVIHGIDGRDLGLAQSLAVDITSNGACLLKGVTFKGIAGPLAVPAGVYNLEVRVGNGNCTGAIAATGRFDLGLGENASFVAHLGEEGAPKIAKFTNDLNATAGTAGRLIVRHTAAAPQVLISVTKGRRRNVGFAQISNGEQVKLDLASMPYTATVFGASRRVRVADLAVELPADKVVVNYAVGTLSKGSFAVISQQFDSAVQ